MCLGELRNILIITDKLWTLNTFLTNECKSESDLPLITYRLNSVESAQSSESSGKKISFSELENA